MANNPRRKDLIDPVTTPFLLWLGKVVLAGLLSGTISFFTKIWWGKWWTSNSDKDQKGHSE